ncbi:MAG: ribonuclease H-like domain-containing protein [Candidatus Sumerlaeota bacterium]|nr:ribonuclease H-like domain-containing protein [Candidatus Sumerlaeota bacterium]
MNRRLAPKRSATGDCVALFDNAERLETPHGPLIRIVHRLRLDRNPDENPPANSGEEKYVLPMREMIPALTDRDFVSIGRDNAFEGMALGDLVMLDVETTGLSGGAGTYAFLVGLGWIEDGVLTVEQFFMEDYDREGAVMHAIAERLDRFRALVTYNGRNFDAPLLRTRFLFNSVARSLDEPNLDLLFPARRVWKKALPDCSLSTVEGKVLNLGGRHSDVPGALVPRIFFDFVNGVRRERMRPVLDHNAQDIISLASLLGLLGRLTRQPAAAPLDHPLALLGLAHLIEWSGRVGESLECMERALLVARDPQLIFHVSSHIARLYKRQARYTEAVDVWASHTATPQPHNVGAFIELAKLLEHKQRDYARAAEVAERARAYCLSQSQLLEDMGRAEEAQRLRVFLEDLEKRARRLSSKLETEILK